MNVKPNMKICRVCIKESPILYNLFQLTALDAEGNEVPVHEMLSVCCSAKLQSDISLWICSTCSEECMKSYNFVKLFQKNDETFRTLEKRTLQMAKNVEVKVEIRNPEHNEVEDIIDNNEDDIEMVDPLLIIVDDDQNLENHINHVNLNDSNDFDQAIAEENATNEEESSTTKPYQCTQCATQFTALSSLRRHMKRFHTEKNKQIFCSLCTKTYTNNKNFDKHYFKEHYCPICEMEFASENKLNRHRVKEHEHEVRKQRVVKKEKVKPESKEKERKEKEFEGKEISDEEMSAYKCPSCGMSFVHKGRFLDHLYNFHNNEIIVCEQCDELFSKSNDYVEHYDDLHYKFCTICEVTLQSRNGVAEHRRKHLVRPCYVTQQTIKCALCQMQGKFSAMISHMKSYHAGQSVDCYICQLQFDDVDSYITHFSKDHRIKCDDCNTYCISLQQYHAHINSKFTGIHKSKRMQSSRDTHVRKKSKKKRKRN